MKNFEETLQPYVEKILSALEKGVNYVGEEIPIILKEYVMFAAIKHWILVIIFVSISILIIRYLYKKFKDRNSFLHDEDLFAEYAPLLIICLIIPLLISISIVILNILPAIQATFFPKLYLIEEFLKHI